MPSYRHLYTVRKVQGQRSDDALELTGSLAPPAGFEAVPGEDARSLVNYLLTLKRDSDLPAGAEGSDSTEPEPAAN